MSRALAGASAAGAAAAAAAAAGESEIVQRVEAAGRSDGRRNVPAEGVARVREGARGGCGYRARGVRARAAAEDTACMSTSACTWQRGEG